MAQDQLSDQQAIARLCALKNIAEKSARIMLQAGIDSPEALAETGAVDAFARMKAIDPKAITTCALWALYGAIHDIPANHVPKEVREELKAQYTSQTSR